MVDAQMIIDIAAKLTGNETTAQLDRMSAALSGTSRWAESLDAAMIHAQSGLAGATAKVEDVTGALAQARDAYRRTAAAEGEASAAAFTHAAKIAALESDLDAATAAQKRYAATVANTAKLTRVMRQRTGDAATRFSNFRGALGDAGGALGGFADRMLRPIQAFVDLREHEGAAFAGLVTGVGVMGSAAAAALALAAAIGVATAAIVAMGIGLADANREAGLAAEAFAAITPAVSGVDFGAIARETNLSADALRGLAKDLDGAKVAAADMPAALRAAALAEKALGQGGAAKFVEQIKAGTLSVAEFADTASESFGGIVQRRLLGLGDQAVTLKRNLAGLFGGLEIEGALESISKLVGMFSEAHVVGRTIKFFFETIFQPFVDAIEGAYYAVEAFVLGFLIGMTKVYIGAKPAIAAVSKFLGFDDSTLTLTLQDVTAAGEFLAPVFIALVGVFALVVGAIVAVVAAFAAVAAAPVLVIAAITSIMDAIMSAVTFVQSIDMGQVASDLWQGFIDGIVNFGPNVVSAITGVVGGAIDAAKSLLGIASPSKVFASIGENTGEGFTQGVEDTEAAAQGALASMVEPPTTSGVSGAAAGESAAEAGASPSVSLDGVTFVFNGVDGAEQALDRFTEAFTRILQGDADAIAGAAT